MEWNKLAEKVKFTSLPKEADLSSIYPEFGVWNWGTGRSATVLGGMQTDLDNGKVLVADYEYEHSRPMHTPADVGGMMRGLSLCILEHDNLDLPEVFMRSEVPMQKVFRRAMGKHDIYFAEDPEFSDCFEIQGPEAEVHQLFRPEIRSYFLRHFNHAPLRMEIRKGTILIHFGMMIPPEDSRILIYSAVNIANFWLAEPIRYNIPPEAIFRNGE